MKVKELIAALTALPPEAADLEVYVWDAGDRLTLVDLDDSFLNDEHPFVDLNTNTDH